MGIDSFSLSVVRGLAWDLAAEGMICSGGFGHLKTLKIELSSLRIRLAFQYEGPDDITDFL